MATLHLAHKLGLTEIHILGSDNLEDLEIFLDPEADDADSADSDVEDDVVLV
jgi:hypothetical protein